MLWGEERLSDLEGAVGCVEAEQEPSLLRIENGRREAEVGDLDALCGLDKHVKRG